MTDLVPQMIPETFPHRLNMRQELFCRAIVQGMSATQAARMAGYSESSAKSQAYRLMTNDDICIRIAELKGAEEAAREQEIASTLEELTSLIKSTRNGGNYASALRAIELRLKLKGVLPINGMARFGALSPLPEIEPLPADEPVFDTLRQAQGEVSGRELP